jgi:hypothetical protein
MKLFLISQSENKGYDRYDALVVAAPNQRTAKTIHPRTGRPTEAPEWHEHREFWCESPKDVKAEYLGEAKDGTGIGLILTSFNAG